MRIISDKNSIDSIDRLMIGFKTILSKISRAITTDNIIDLSREKYD